MDHDSFMLGYVMGLIVGEGCFTGCKKRPALTMKQKQNLLPLTDCMKLLGGRINGEYVYPRKEGNVNRYHMWTLSSKDLLKAIPIFDKHLPHSEKRKQYIKWTHKYEIRVSTTHSFASPPPF